MLEKETAEGSLEIPRERGPQKPKFLKESMKQNWNFQKGGGLKPKKHYVGEVWIFSGTTHFVLFLVQPPRLQSCSTVELYRIRFGILSGVAFE